MKKYIIKPNSGHPYININIGVAHEEMGKPSPAQRGEVMLNVKHTTGVFTCLPFYKSELQEVA